MDICQEILKIWEGIQNTDAERDAFDKYTKAREEYLEGLKKSATGSITMVELKILSETEKEYFVEYIKCRIKLKDK